MWEQDNCPVEISGAGLAFRDLIKADAPSFSLRFFCRDRACPERKPNGRDLISLCEPWGNPSESPIYNLKKLFLLFHTPFVTSALVFPHPDLFSGTTPPPTLPAPDWNPGVSKKFPAKPLDKALRYQNL